MGFDSKYRRLDKDLVGDGTPLAAGRCGGQRQLLELGKRWRTASWRGQVFDSVLNTALIAFPITCDFCRSWKHHRRKKSVMVQVCAKSHTASGIQPKCVFDCKLLTLRSTCQNMEKVVIRRWFIRLLLPPTFGHRHPHSMAIPGREFRRKKRQQSGQPA